MLRKHPRNDMLGRLIADAVLAAENGDGTTPRSLAATIFEAHRSELEDYAFDLVLDAITVRVRKALKQSSKSDDQYLLPEIGDALPRFISVPADDEDDSKYIPLRRSRLGQVRRSTEGLWKGIAADTRRAQALDALIERCEALGGRDDDFLIDILARRAA